MGKGHPYLLDVLFPKGTTARDDLEGLFALRTQLPEFFNVIEPDDVTALLSSAPPSFPITESEALKNALRSTPKKKGIKTLKYEILREWKAGDGALDGSVELRKYNSAKVFRKEVFNDDKEDVFIRAMGRWEIGTRVEVIVPPPEISSGDDKNKKDATAQIDITFVADQLQDGYDGFACEEMPEKLVAVKRFPGIATREEVERQRTLLIASIEADGAVVADPDCGGSYSVLFYNPPYTLPWRRQNEVSIAVKPATDQAGEDQTKVSTTLGQGNHQVQNEIAALREENLEQ
jgi:hypothetical protein